MTELTCRQEHDVLTVEVDRPPANLLTLQMCEELTRLLLDPPEGARILRLRASGDRFCMGRERAAEGTEDLGREVGVLIALNEAFERSRLVTVTEVQGDAAGFGVGLVALSDVSLAKRSARLSFPEVTVDLAPALVLAWLPRVVGRREAFWLTASGEAVGADRAMEIGLLNGVVDTDEQLRAAADERVALLTAHSARIHSEIRAMLSSMADLTQAQAYELSRDRLVIGSMRRRRT
ncbi:MAG: enoyl-CoA hydratase/isomerase family protein [Acidimicrobiales bacterium]